MFGLIVCLLIWISAQGPSWSFEKGHLHLDDYVAPQKVVNIMGEYAAMEETPFSTTPDHIFQGFLNKNLIATVYLYNWDNRIIEPTICVHHTVQGKRYATLIMKYLMSEIEKEEYKGYIIAAQREIQGGRTPFHSFLYRAGFKVLGRNTQEFWGYVYVRP